MNCPKCSQALVIGAKFCIHCGARLAPAETVASAAPDLACGQTVFEDFLIERELGQGGMGKVYLVRNCVTGQRLAMKISHERDADARRQFLAELQTWIDLPAHPHLVACHFVRAAADRLAIFAEYVPGGSLADWIAARKVRRLDQVLDVAIQSAWGLQAAHDRALVHQDVKPGNLLLSGDGVVKVADFGLARARSHGGRHHAATTSTAVATKVGMTPAYCSPEQAAGKKLTPQSDIWSWGLTVLEMALGEVTWASGGAAAAVLDHVAAQTTPSATGIVLPEPVLAILRECFRAAPRDRWPSMSAAADRLVDAYAQLTGRAYARARPAAEQRADAAPQVAARHVPARQSSQRTWDNPRDWLVMALEEAGRDPAEAERLLPPAAESRQGRLVADLAAYEEASRILEQLVRGGRRDLEIWLASLHDHVSLVHHELGDFHSMERRADRALALLEAMPDCAKDVYLLASLFSALSRKANAIQHRDLHAACAVMDRAIRLMETGLRGAAWSAPEHAGPRPKLRWGHLRPDHLLATLLASGHNTRGMYRRSLGMAEEALSHYERAIDLREDLIRAADDWEFQRDLATSYMNKANVLYTLDRADDALDFYNRALKIRERLVRDEGRTDVMPSLALVCQNKAALLMAHGRFGEAQELCVRAVDLYEELVAGGKGGFAADLGRSLRALADTHLELAEFAQGLATLDRGVELAKRLVFQEGRRDLVADLAAAQALRGEILWRSGSTSRGRREVEQAISLLEREPGLGQHRDLQRQLEQARATLAQMGR